MTDQIILGIMSIIGFVVFALIVAALSRPTVAAPPPSPPPPACALCPTDDDDWEPLDTSPVMGYANLRQGGQHVGYAEMRRLHLPAGWQAGPRGMRPSDPRARAERRRLRHIARGHDVLEHAALLAEIVAVLDDGGSGEEGAG